MNATLAQLPPHMLEAINKANERYEELIAPFRDLNPDQTHNAMIYLAGYLASAASRDREETVVAAEALEGALAATRRVK